MRCERCAALLVSERSRAAKECVICRATPDPFLLRDLLKDGRTFDELAEDADTTGSGEG